MNRRVIYAAIAVLVLGLGYWSYHAIIGRMRQFDPQELTAKHDRLVKHNAQFLGRDRVAARYKIDLTGQRGLTCFAYYRVPVADRKLPAMLLLYSNPRGVDFTAMLSEIARVNELAVLALNVDSCFGGPTREQFSVYSAAQLCLDYLDVHFTIDTNKVFLAGWDRGNLFALPLAVVDGAPLAGLILNLPLEASEDAKLNSAARWGSGSFHKKLLVVTPGSATDGALANWTKSAGMLPANDQRKAKTGETVPMLSEAVDWILGPPVVVDTTATTAPVTFEEAQKNSLQMRKK